MIKEMKIAKTSASFFQVYNILHISNNPTNQWENKYLHVLAKLWSSNSKNIFRGQKWYILLLPKF